LLLTQVYKGFKRVLEEITKITNTKKLFLH
jgi:hypothetical protein